MNQLRSSSLNDVFNRSITRLLNSKRNNNSLFSLSGSARSLYLSLLSDRATNPLLIIADTYESAESAFQDLSFFSDRQRVGFFPHWDTVPYDNQSPDADVVATRFSTLAKLALGKADMIVTTPNAIMQRIMPTSVFSELSFTLSASQQYERGDLLNRLSKLGFIRVDMVEEKGEFSVRGEIIDIFPITESKPARLDFFDDDLESVKYFDIETQRSAGEVSSISIFPAREALLKSEGIDEILDKLKSIKANTVPQVYNTVVESLRTQIGFPGMESLLPLFYPSTATVLDYYHESPHVVFLERERVRTRVEDFFNEVAREYEYSREEGNPTLDPEELYLSPSSLFGRLDSYRSVDIQSIASENYSEEFELSTVDNTALRSIASSVGSTGQSDTQLILSQLKKWNLAQAKIAIAVESFSKADRIKQMAEEIGLSISIQEENSSQKRKSFFIRQFSETETSFLIFPTPINTGFRWIDKEGVTKVALVSEEEIFGPKQRQRRVQKSSLKQFFSSIGDLKTGDYVVHVEYGIGKYEGLKKITAEKSESDFLVIAYRGGDKLYVPVDKFHLVQKYSGGDVGRPNMDKLGGKSWKRTKSKIKSEIDDMADELVKINAARKAKKGVAFSPDSTLMNEFALGFLYQETEDQEKAIRDVMRDMESERPMDRLVCGDVGFGKTEVAMRAAYKAVIDGYQVGMLVPTTILTQQHFESFKKRFKNTPVEIGLLSRFLTAKQVKKTIDRLKNGSIDIIVGTHRLLSKDVEFNRLGVLIIDEEQRFGVKHKERIRKYRTTVDTLTLSATPIPRTLHMTLVGIRDISVINTPPMDRRAIRTRLLKFNDYVIQEAVNREIRRKGQIFFIHNRVDSIYQMGEYLSKMMPKLRIAVAHGQMAEKDLERVMIDFIDKKFDMLLSTTIVESGLDIPNVNTILINNADKFGLSQLYQLRGRVGRSDAQAYSYLLTPREKTITEMARKRLLILRELNHLGAGFKIANYDLELRGAGNVLGSKQSGHIAAVGFELYTSMIEDAVQQIQLGEEKKEATKANELVLELMGEANIPDAYISNMNQRLDAYKSISSCETEEELWDIRASLEDRYGKMPEKTVTLFHFIQVKLLAASIGISKLRQSYDSVELVFSEAFEPDQNRLINFLNNTTYSPKLLPDNKIVVRLNHSTAEDIFRFLHFFKKEMGLG